MIARLSRNCAEALETGSTETPHICTGCEGCVCHKPPTGPTCPGCGHDEHSGFCDCGCLDDRPPTRLAAPGALREAFRAVKAGEDVRVPVIRSQEGTEPAEGA